MKRFLMVLAVAATAGAMYVAAAPGSSARHAPPTWKQFAALQKQVASLKKQVAQVDTTATSAYGFIQVCFLTNNAGAIPVGLFGDVQNLGGTQTYGYGYYATPGVLSYRTALNVDTSPNPQFFVQVVDPACPTTGAASHAAGHLMLRAERKP
jgi:hypothetical protein